MSVPAARLLTRSNKFNIYLLNKPSQYLGRLFFGRLHKPMRRIFLFVLIALLSLWIGFTWFGEGTLHKVVIYLGYPNLFIVFGLFLLSIVRLQRQDRYWQAIRPRKRIAYLAILLVSGVLLLMEPLGFQIVYDELILSVSGQLMHFDRLAGVPQQANDYFGSYKLMEVMLDKRPFFFPFLLSLVHDLSGFRYQNVFYLNACLTVILFLLIYLIGKVFSGHKGGLLAVLLGGTLPMLSIFATSGHFEILNLVMICLVLLLSIHYIREPEAHRLVPLVLALLLLAQVRYENSLYLLPFGILILLGWVRARQVILPWPVMISPLFLIMNAIQFRMIQEAEHGFFQEGPNGRTDTFSLSYAGENLASAKNFFFAIGSATPNSYLLTVFGIASVVGFLVLLFNHKPSVLARSHKSAGACALVAAIFLFACVVTFFNFGLFDRHITSRLSLPIHLLFILLPPYVLRRLGREYIVILLITGLGSLAFSLSGFDRKALLSTGIMMIPLVIGFTAALLWIWKRADNPRSVVLALPVIFILTTTIPVGHAHRYSQNYVSNDILLTEIQFIEERKDQERILFISENQYSSMLTETNATYISTLKENPKVAQEHLKRNMYASIYVSRAFERGDKGILQLSKEKHHLDPDVFELETVAEIHIGANNLMKFERLLDVHLPTEESD